MKPHKKTTKDPLQEKPLHKKKKQDKPWVVEFMIVDKNYQKTFFEKERDLNTWYVDGWFKFISLKQGIEQIEKYLRSWSGLTGKEHWRFAGKIWQFRDTDNNTIVPFEISKNKVTVKDEKK